jgi:L-idonate 5-dehydrogenase
MVKSLSYVGAFRFVHEYAKSVDLLAQGVPSVSPFLTAAVPVARRHEPLELVANRDRALKVVVPS